MSRKNRFLRINFIKKLYLMGWFENIKEFLTTKMKEEQLKTTTDLANRTGIPQTTMREMLGNRRPEIKNILQIANSFNCSIDEVLGREFVPDKRQKYIPLSLEELSANLKNFINKELVKNNLTQYELGAKIGRSNDAVRPFLREGDNNQKMLTTETVVVVADYFKASIDEMVGRVPPLEKEQQIERPLNNNLKKLSPELRKAAQLIGKSIEKDISKAPIKEKVTLGHVSSITKKSSNNSRSR